MKRKLQIKAAGLLPKKVQESLLRVEADKGDLNSKRALRFGELVKKREWGGLSISENAELAQARKWVMEVLKQEGLK